MHYITKTIIDKLGRPYNKCDDDTSDLNNHLTNQVKLREFDYRQVYCYNLCRLKFMEIACNCSLQYQLYGNGSDTCSKSCIERFLATFDYEKSCKDCSVECDYVVYEMKIERRNITRFIYDSLNTTKKYSGYKVKSLEQNLTALNFNFENMQYTEIKEMSRTNFVALIGELGGTVGKY